MSVLRSEQLEALKRLLSRTPIQAAAATGMPLACAEQFISKGAEFVAIHHATMATHRYVFVLCPQVPSGKPVTAPEVLRHANAGNRMLCVNEDFGLVAHLPHSARLADVSGYTKEKKAFAIIAEGTYVHQLLCGNCVDEGDVLHAESDPPAHSPWHRPIEQFDLLVEDHRANCLDQEKQVRYWQDRRKRLLLHGADGTELIFHQSLFWWLKTYARDALRVFAEPKGLGQDKTDIMVVTVSGSHVVEVKWLGKNERGQAYRQARIDEGLVQVGLYLNRDTALVAGHLVIYDARSAEDHTKKSTYTPAKIHAKCARPLIVFLVSETPSETAANTGGI